MSSLFMFFYNSCGDVAANIADNWTLQRQNEYAFSSVACDQTIEHDWRVIKRLSIAG